MLMPKNQIIHYCSTLDDTNQLRTRSYSQSHSGCSTHSAPVWYC